VIIVVGDRAFFLASLIDMKIKWNTSTFKRL